MQFREIIMFNNRIENDTPSANSSPITLFTTLPNNIKVTTKKSGTSNFVAQYGELSQENLFS
jgi:hypothetical protein